MHTIRPIHDRVLVERIAAPDRIGSIYVPDNAKEKPIEGKVVAVGSGRRRDDGTAEPMEVQPGDRVLFGKYSGTEVKLDGTELLIIREEDVLGVIS